MEFWFFNFIYMILIISQEKFEETTNSVIDWLSYKNVEFIRINGIDFYRKSTINFDQNVNIEVNNVNLINVKTVWFRRYYTRQNLHEILIKDIPFLSTQINDYIRREIFAFNEFIIHFFGKKLINRTGFKNINKLSVLKTALECNLIIPKTKVVNDYYFSNENEEYITKAMSEAPSLNYLGSIFLGYTKPISIETSNEKKKIAPSLIQEKVEKAFEIRSFFIGKAIYSMAIFSQNNSKTTDDFRVYDTAYPNRYCPYQLDKKIEKKLLKLAKKLKLLTGSFDLIMGKNDKIYFLEVNPDGQFGMVSYPCNYFLEEKVATFLIKKLKKNE